MTSKSTFVGDTPVVMTGAEEGACGLRGPGRDRLSRAIDRIRHKPIEYLGRT